MGMGMKPINRLGSAIHDMVNWLKMQSQEHMIQYQGLETLEMHKDVAFSIHRERWEEDEVEAERAGRTFPSDEHFKYNSLLAH
ncbi:MAG: hypothetical protein Q9197_000357 [Variospora fuerteventurae]